MEALLIVDPQNDFMPNGALPVPDGDKIIPVVNEWMNLARQEKWPVIFSLDLHTPGTANHDGWPTHCVAETWGSSIHPDIPNPDVVVRKGQDNGAYSAFEGSASGDGKAPRPLHEFLQDHGIKTLYVMGLALDYCVKKTVLDALNLGYEVILVLEGTRAVNVNPSDGMKARLEMKKAGADILV